MTTELPYHLRNGTSKVIVTKTLVKSYDPQTGNKLINNYMLLNEIGRGVHGKVKLAQNIQTGELVALKIVDKRNRKRQMGYGLLRGSHHQNGSDNNAPKEYEQKIIREILILQKCLHPNVVRLYEVIDIPENRKIYMALEYTENGEIEWRDDNDKPIMSSEQSRKIFRDIVNGLDYLHYQGVLHRDIKPANLLLTQDGTAKISDFGVSYYNELLAAYNKRTPTPNELSKMEKELSETVGTPAFFAPELCSAVDNFSTHTAGTLRISKPIDVWALGVTLYCFIFGRCPFLASTEFELFDTIPTQPLRFPKKEDVGFEIGKDLEDLLLRLLTKNPEDRITLDQVKVQPWVTEDLENPQEWLIRTQPQNYSAGQIVQTPTLLSETDNAGIMERLRQSIKRLSIFGNKRKTAISSSSFQTNDESAITNDTYASSLPRYSQSYISRHQPLHSQITTSVTPATSLITEATTATGGSQLLPINNGISHSRMRQSILSNVSVREGSCLDDDRSLEDFNASIPSSFKRPQISRQTSSASSASSGMGLTFGNYRNRMTPIS
ncbi:kinase-like domain-containing protein [Mycotypha africana]|uniref:kinase-like domain-containing protein n=1 Tax=Mycotypha africana TaxID=64632 RepID=UPI002301760F|nr:kinase-like domain-containing protein [Mycotypha africana]KAI8987795.1 kinase-like domain-containing protein [Mycotypha africana]